MHASDVEALIRQHGFPLYIYDSKAISEQIFQLKKTFKDFDILYSMKCNTNPDICRYLIRQNLGIDAASRHEVLTARTLGLPKEKIFFSAPGKTSQDLRETLDQCVLIADSYSELKKLDALCAELKCLSAHGFSGHPEAREIFWG